MPSRYGFHSAWFISCLCVIIPGHYRFSTMSVRIRRKLPTPTVAARATLAAFLRPRRQSASRPAIQKANTAGNINIPMEKAPSSTRETNPPVMAQVNRPQRCEDPSLSRATPASPASPNMPISSRTKPGKGHRLPRGVDSLCQKGMVIPTLMTAPITARINSIVRFMPMALGKRGRL